MDGLPNIRPTLQPATDNRKCASKISGFKGSTVRKLQGNEVIGKSGYHICKRPASASLAKSFSQSTELYEHEQAAYAAVRKVQYRIGEGKDIPTFKKLDRKTLPLLLEQYPELRELKELESEKGSVILRLADAIREILYIMNDMGLIHTKIRVEDVEKNVFSDMAKALKQDNCFNMSYNILPIIDGINLNMLNAAGIWGGKIMGSWSHIFENIDDQFKDNPPIDYYTINLLLTKLLSRFLVNKVSKHPTCWLYMDIDLIKASDGNVLLPLYFNPEQLSRWLDCLQREADAVDVLYSPYEVGVSPRQSEQASILKYINLISWRHSKAEYILDGQVDYLDGQVDYLVTSISDCVINHYIPNAICNLLFYPEASHDLSSKSDCSDNSIHNFEKVFLSRNRKKIEPYFGDEMEYDCKGRKWDQSKKLYLDLVEKLSVRARTLIHEDQVCKQDIKNEKCLLFVDTGNWQFKAFRDDVNLEFTVTPYQCYQKFKVFMNGEEELYDSYKLFDEFIASPVKELGFTGVSGHKHLDIRGSSLDGNVELLFRIIVDMENNPWLPKAFNRLGSLEYFSYVQGNKEHFQLLQTMIKAVNARLESGGYNPRFGNYSDMVKLANFMNKLGLNTKYSACALHHLKNSEYTVNINISPTSTIEFRQFHCPRNGDESRLVNELLTERIEYLMDCQQRREPIAYEPVDPKTYEGKDTEVIRLFAEYVKECGNKPEYFKPLLRIPAPQAQQFPMFT
nr:hypothetical protein [Endozoicomonas sp.]